MSEKITLDDLGKLVKIRVLTKAFLLCVAEQQNFETDSWWRGSCDRHRKSKSYKQDMIAGTYGVKNLASLFETLDPNNYVAEITSFLVLHALEYKIVKTKEEIDALLNERSFRGVCVIAAGVKIYKTYDVLTRELGPEWEPTSTNTVAWFYETKQLLPVEDVENFNDVEAGDMIVFGKTQALVVSVKVLARRKFYNTCSWTNKRIMVLSGDSRGRQARLIANRPFRIIKSFQDSSSSSSSDSDSK